LPGAVLARGGAPGYINFAPLGLSAKGVALGYIRGGFGKTATSKI